MRTLKTEPPVAPSALPDLLDFIRHPSISTDPARKTEVAACAEWLATYLRQGGLETKVHPTPGHPIIVSRAPIKPGRPTLMIYGHYDVQPVDPIELWDNDPFEPIVRDGFIIARGATDNKGQIMAHIRGVIDDLTEHGELPLNVFFLIEGEEEIGSANLVPFLREYKKELACDVVAVSDTGMVAPRVPTFTYGLRGIAALEVKIHGPAMDLHSGMFGGAILNPATVAGRLVAALHDDCERVRIPGFYDDVIPLADWERESWARLPITDDDYLKMTGAPSLHGEKGYSALERIAGRPTAEVNGIGGGYQGAGTKTVIPSEAFVKLTFRLVPGQCPEKILRAAETFFRDNAPLAVRVVIEPGHSAPAYLTDPQSGFGRAACRALERAWERPPALIREGGSIPVVQSFKEILGVDTLLLGLALPDCRAHSPNETFPVENFQRGILMSRLLMEEIAAMVG